MQKMNARMVLGSGAKAATYNFDSVAVTTLDDEVVVKLTDRDGHSMRLTFARTDLRRLFNWKDVLSS